jgi:ATP-binding cassette subfamily B protein
MEAYSLPKTLVKFVWHFTQKQPLMFWSVAFLSLAWAAEQTIFPYVFSQIIEIISSYKGEDKGVIWDVLSKPILLGISLWFAIEICLRTAGFLIAKMFPVFESNVRMGMLKYVLGHSHSYFSHNFSGQVANKISDMPNSLSHILELLLSLLIPTALAVLIALGIFFYIHPLFAKIMLVWVVIHLGICIWYSQRCTYASNIHSAARSYLMGRIVDTLTNHLNVVLFARRPYELSYIKTFQKTEQERHADTLMSLQKVKTLLEVTTFLGSWLGLNGLALYYWQKNLISVGDVVLVFNTNWNITMLLWWAGLELPTFFKEVGICRQALSVVEDQPEVVDKPGSLPLRVSQGEISFKNVEFWYADTIPFFNKKSITIKGGEKVGLVGLSGSGKSTFVNLVLRLFDIKSGEITIDGQDIRKVTLESLHDAISIIPQDPTLFHRNLMENIRYGRVDATQEEVEEAAKMAHAHEFIQSLQEGYDTAVGERGSKLSGGQRQRVAIARAFLKNAPILVLDEATSALDSVTEKQIQESLNLLMQGKTVLVIAHRLSTLRYLERILVFHNGRIVEDGPHDQLIALNGHYAKLWNMQVGGLLPYKAALPPS